MDIKLRNKIVAATTLVSFIIIGISIGVWSRRGEETVDTFNPATAKIALGCITCTPDPADPGFCTGELSVSPPFKKGNIEKVERVGYVTKIPIRANKISNRHRTLKIEVG